MPNFCFYCSCRGCFLSSPVDFPLAGAKLLLPAQFGTSCFQTCVLSPHIIPYATASPFLRHFPPPASAGSIIFAASFADNLPPRTRQFGANRPFVGPLFFHLPAASQFVRFRVFCGLIRRQFAASHSLIWARIASSSDHRSSACLLHLDLAGSVSAFLPVQVFSLSRSGNSGTRWLVRGFLRGPSSRLSVKSLPYLLHCSRKFFLLVWSSGSSDCQIEFVNIFTSHFSFWKNLLPVPFRHCFDPILFQFRSGVDPFYLQLFHFIVTLNVHSLISINRSALFQHLNSSVSHGLSNSSMWRASGAGTEQPLIFLPLPGETGICYPPFSDFGFENGLNRLYFVCT